MIIGHFYFNDSVFKVAVMLFALVVWVALSKTAPPKQRQTVTRIADYRRKRR